MFFGLSLIVSAQEKENPLIKPDEIVKTLVVNAKKGEAGVFSLLHDSKLKSHVSASLKQSLEVLEAENDALKKIPNAKEKYGWLIVGAQCDGYDVFNWWPYWKPHFIEELGCAARDDIGKATVRLFEADPIEESGKGTGPYSALVEFHFRFEMGVWQLNDIHVSHISDRLQIFDLTDQVAEKVSKIKEARRQIEKAELAKRSK
jgi:hypothetical protein